MSIKIWKYLDTSDYSADHPLYSQTNTKLIGKFKDDLKGKIMTELVFLRSKAYAFLINNEEEIKKLKGITKATIKNSVSFQDFKDALINHYDHMYYRKMHVLNSHNHEMFVKEINKKAISPFDDKSWIDNYGIATFPHGYQELYFT